MDLRKTASATLQFFWEGAEPIWIAFLTVLKSPVTGSSRIYWLYVLSSLGFALAIYLRIRRRERRAGVPAPASARDFLEFCFPPSIWKNASAWLDLRYFLFHRTVTVILLPAATIVSIAAVSSQTALLVGQFLESPLLVFGELDATTVVLFTLISTLLVDFSGYVVHWLQHKVNFLWEFHKVHHSLEVMHPISNYREHPVDLVLYVWVSALCYGVVLGWIAALMGVEPGEIDFLRNSAAVFAFNFLAYNLRHSHIWLAWPPWLGRVFGSPANHQFHHSREARHLDKNFGFMFALWDWIFGTLYLPRERETFRIGLADGSADEYDSVYRLYSLPFQNLYANIASRLGKGRGAAG